MQTKHSSSKTDTTVFLGRIPRGVPPSTVRALITACGPVTSLRMYVDATKGFALATFESIQGVYLAKKLLESVVLHGRKVMVHCNRATTARLRSETFKYGQEEREAEAAVKVRIEGLVEGCDGEEAGVEGEQEGGVEAAKDFLDGLMHEGGVLGGVANNNNNMTSSKNNDKAGRDANRHAGNAKNDTDDGGYQERFELMKRNEVSRLRRLEKEADRRRDAVQERRRQVLADNEGVGDVGMCGALRGRKGWRGTKEWVERGKWRGEELAEDAREAARAMIGRDGERMERSVAEMSERKRVREGEEDTARVGEGDGEGEGGRRGAMMAETAGATANIAATAIGAKKSRVINFDDEDEDGEDAGDRKKEDIVRAVRHRAQCRLASLDLGGKSRRIFTDWHAHLHLDRSIPGRHGADASSTSSEDDGPAKWVRTGCDHAMTRPPTQVSTTPPLHHSTISSLHHYITPPLHHSTRSRHRVPPLSLHCRYPIKWDVFDAAPKTAHRRVAAWIGKKIAELLGEEEEEFVEFIFEGVQNHKHPRDLAADLQDVLDDDTDAFVVELYGKVIAEIENL